MKYTTLLLLTLLFTTQNIYCQNLKGRVTDKSGEGIYGASLYIKGINQGLICNEEGYYQTNIPAGNYEIEYKSLGFKPVLKKVSLLKDSVTTLNVIMEENIFSLSEVTVSGKEDPAYAIMRKAIEKAPLYDGAILEYTADAYIKGNAELLGVSSLIDNLAKKGEGIKLSDFKEQVFVQESFNEIHFTAPDKYKQTVKAFSSSIPDNLDSEDAMGIMNASLYKPKLGGYISPLHPKAFSYYKFRYEGFSEEGDITINKIKVESKLKDPILVNGYIYIADNTWHIHSAELTMNNYGVKQDYTVSYQEIEKEGYLPITYLLKSHINLLGINATIDYYASLTYKDIKINKDIVKVLAEQKEKKKKREFEIKRDSTYITISDSLAKKRDSIYWANIRVIPLDEREKLSLLKKDSIQHHLDSVRKEFNDASFSFSDIFSGGRIGGDSAKFTFRYDGIIQGLIYEYNFVDGAWLGQKFDLSTKIKSNNKLTISPYVYYTTARRKVIWGGDINFLYARMKRGVLNISGGSISENYNPEGIHRLNNASSSLVRGKNYSYFYQKNHITLNNSIDISNGFKFMTGFEIAKRSGLSNNTKYTWGSKKKITPNIFPDDKFDKTSYSIGFDYTPYAYYTVWKGVKRYVRYTSPTFMVRYSEAFGNWQTNNSQYRKIRAGIYQNIKISEFSRIDYFVEGGSFLGNKKRMHFADYQHFNTANVTVNLKSPFQSFMLLDNYIASTNEYWAKAILNYESNYILLKRLPFLQGKMFTESIHLKTLYTPEFKPYSELGYSINITNLLNFGVFASFKKEKYQDFGIRVLFDLETTKRIF